MKRGIACLLALAAVFLFASCAGGKKTKSAEEIAREVISEVFSDAAAFAVCGKEELLKPEKDGSTLFSQVFRGAPPALYTDAFADCAAAFLKKDCGAEMEIFIAAHPSEKDRLRELLELRLKTLRAGDVKNYLFEDYDRFLSSAQIYEKGNCVCLVALGDNRKAIAALERLL